MHSFDMTKPTSFIFFLSLIWLKNTKENSLSFIYFINSKINDKNWKIKIMGVRVNGRKLYKMKEMIFACPFFNILAQVEMAFSWENPKAQQANKIPANW